MVTSMIPNVNNIFVNKSIVDMRFLSAYNPYINYTWEMLPNAKVKNSGTSGVDLQLYSGNPLDFQATQGVQVNKSFTLSGNAISLYLGFDTDSIAITHTLAEFDNLKVSIVNATLKVTINAVEHNVATIALNTYYQTEIVINSNNLTVKLNGTQTYSASCTALNTTILKSLGANDGLASGRFDGQFDYFIAYNGLTTFSLPNQFFKDMSINSNTLFCTDFRGTAEYIADSKNYSEGSQLFINPDFTIDLNGWVGTTFLSWNNGGCSFNSDRDDSLYQYNFSVGKIYKCIFKIRSITTGSIKCTFGPSTMSASVTSEGEYTFIGKCKHYTQPDGYASYLNISGTGTDAIIEYAFAYEVSGVYPITNYPATQRTNFTQVNKGLQDLTRSFDSNGFFVDNVSYLNCNGKGKATIVEPSRTSNITIKTNPTTLSGNILSGGVVKTTAGLASGVDNDIVLSNQVISSNIDIGVGFIGKISVYKEDKLS